MTTTRTYLDVRFDVTDLNEDERGALAMEVAVQAESSEGHGSVDSPEIEWNEVEVEEDWAVGRVGGNMIRFSTEEEAMAAIHGAELADPGGAAQGYYFVDPPGREGEGPGESSIYSSQIVGEHAGAAMQAEWWASRRISEWPAGQAPNTPESGYTLTVCLDSTRQGRDFDPIEEAVEAVGEALNLYAKHPDKTVSIVVSDGPSDFAAPPVTLTADQAMSILFEEYGTPEFDAANAPFASGADVCASLASYFDLTDEQINILSRKRCRG